MRASGSRATHTTVLGCACEGPGGMRQCGLVPVAKARHNQCGWPMPRSVVPLATVRGALVLTRSESGQGHACDSPCRACKVLGSGCGGARVWPTRRCSLARCTYSRLGSPRLAKRRNTSADCPCLDPGGPCERPRGQCDGLGGPDSLRRPSGLFTTYRLLACDAVALRTCGWRLTRFRAVPGLSRPTAAPAAAPQPELLRHDPRLLLQRSEVVPLRS
jgi:hypothetical protein